MTILDEIAQYSAIRILEDQRTFSLEDLKKQCDEILKTENDNALNLPDEDGLFRFGQALKKPGLSVISEIKKASPSKGVISEDFPFLDIAGAYERGGADCISCLTEPRWFQGSDEIFTSIRAYTKLPMLRKDFVVDEYQIYQAKTLGANAVLLICALLDTETIRYYLSICRELHMDALVETHDEEEIRSAVAAGAKIIGVNNRNLKDFSVNFENASTLRNLIPKECIYVAESGVTGAEDAKVLEEIGADAVLIGEALMRAENKKKLICAIKNVEYDENEEENEHENQDMRNQENGGLPVSERGNAGLRGLHFLAEKFSFGRGRKGN